jgi:hypothetical protein
VIGAGSFPAIFPAIFQGGFQAFSLGSLHTYFYFIFSLFLCDIAILRYCDVFLPLSNTCFQGGDFVG